MYIPVLSIDQLNSLLESLKSFFITSPGSSVIPLCTNWFVIYCSVFLIFDAVSCAKSKSTYMSLKYLSNFFLFRLSYDAYSEEADLRGGRNRDFILCQLVEVVKRSPIAVFRQYFRSSFPWTKIGVIVKHIWKDLSLLSGSRSPITS